MRNCSSTQTIVPKYKIGPNSEKFSPPRFWIEAIMVHRIGRINASSIINVPIARGSALQPTVIE